VKKRVNLITKELAEMEEPEEEEEEKDKGVPH
jgi:hypothetical protein